MKILSDIFIPPIVPDRTKLVRLQFEFDDEANKISVDEFWDFCVQNDKLQIELTKENEITITFPKGFEFSQKSLELLLQFGEWEKTYQTGIVFNHLVGYVLPTGLIFSPSFSWIKKERFEILSKEQKEKLIHLCPDFVLELRSATDNLKQLQDKMIKYIENGARLGWLIDPKNRRVHIYRANGEVEILENPEKLSGEDILENFALDLNEVW
ncbi:MAG: Uma2 family endonuclease [Acidobacteriota bacterium]|nr:Uma2 family endonuclease [Acidobacteriota bacterium]